MTRYDVMLWISVFVGTGAAALSWYGKQHGWVLRRYLLNTLVVCSIFGAGQYQLLVMDQKNGKAPEPSATACGIGAGGCNPLERVWQRLGL